MIKVDRVLLPRVILKAPGSKLQTREFVITKASVFPSVSFDAARLCALYDLCVADVVPVHGHPSTLLFSSTRT